MTILTADPSRFKPYREPLLVTLARTGAIAIGVASIVTTIQLHHLPSRPAQWHQWLALLVFVAWISFGGHWLEIAYLNGIRPRIAHWPDSSLLFLRLGVWIVGGATLFVAAAISRSVLLTGGPAPRPQVYAALLLGGPAFIIVELIAHAFLLRAGKPSFWNRRG